MPSYTRFRQTALVCAVTLGFLSSLPVSATAQEKASTADSISVLIREGDDASRSRQSAQALALYEQALAKDSMSFDALWRASRELVDMGEFEPDKAVQKARYQRAEKLARKAVALRPNSADVHFHLARAVGRAAMAASPRERVRYAMEVRSQALAALDRDPNHAGALHIMGVWNAEVMRLNPIARTFAKTFMGGQAMKTASWSEALRLLERSAEIEPQRLVHRLDMARVLSDMGQKAEAREAYQAALSMPLTDPNDDRYRQAAEEELKRLGK